MANNISHQDIIAYTKSLSENSEDVLDHFRFDQTELQGAIRSGIQFPAFALESHEGDFSGSTIHNTVLNKTFAFSILLDPKRGNYDQQNEYLNVAEAIGIQFIARMRLDSSNKEHFLHKALKIDEVKFHKVGPIFSSKLYGYRFEVSLNNNGSLKVDPSKWKDIDSVC